MKCPVCNVGRTAAAHVTVTLERDGTTVVFKNVPADVCENCGEQYVSEDVTATLLEAAKAAATEGVEVEVRDYAGLSAA